jgi:carbamoyl-phosphate synthase/aspartate carbamoyltransferase/dihydroorotase
MNSIESVDAFLVLENGNIYKGKSFGAQSNVHGEMVFQTGMVGYTESLTDPSYNNQILVLTYPLIGNYGIPSTRELDEYGLPKYFESDKVHVSALIVGEYVHDYSHAYADISLHQYLLNNNIPGITGIDTRELTLVLRNYGSMAGKIVYNLKDSTLPIDIPVMSKITMSKEPLTFNPAPTPLDTANTNTVKVNTVKVLAIDCGIKYSQIRSLGKTFQTTNLFDESIESIHFEVQLVPWDYNFESLTFDRLFISNGPGDPQTYGTLITNLRNFMNTERGENTPIFGICMGHQILGLAAGGSTYKMKFGNRGHNIPCKFRNTKRCYITSQNHGYAVNTSDIQEYWKDLFVNCNDQSNEGIEHSIYPWWSCQFHPEANAGPRDTSWLFDRFLIQGYLQLTDQQVEEIQKVDKVLLLGSGGLSIGQSGEFDYSGSQAIKAFKESNVKVILINPNIATVQTTPGIVDEIYFLPVTPEFVEKVIEIERPDYIALSFGGQTALNCGVALYESGVLDRYNIKVLGTPIEAIKDTEDRLKFKNRMEAIGERVANGFTVTSVEEAHNVVDKMGYPVLIRAAYALGGLGSGFAENRAELDKLLTVAFSNSNQVSIDESLKGWKELEYEIVRDKFDNCISVCNMENIDPVGIHTGESIVVAPSQTLNDNEYQTLRDVAVKAVRSLGIVGECNIQYAVNPNPDKNCERGIDFRIIEINARLSRSSALASKATGYPLAYIAAKLGLGISLSDIKNEVTGSTSACFEPSLDYCVIKVPRWDLIKFPMVSTKIDSSMKSIGESMAISRSFEEAFQKAFRMANPTIMGFEPNHTKCNDIELSCPSYTRILAIATGLYSGEYTVESMHKLTNIDKWFLHKFQNIINVRKQLENNRNEKDLLKTNQILKAKQLGFSDAQIANAIGITDLKVRDFRKQNDIKPFVKQIDTVAGEFPCITNYLYMTYNGSSHDIDFYKHPPPHPPLNLNTVTPVTTVLNDSQSSIYSSAILGGAVIVLGSGVYKIGSSVEFDWCAVGCIRELRRIGKKVIVINCNPETVSTDYDEADKLYFDELTFETVMDIYEMEQTEGIIVSMGGQIPNNIALGLHHQKVKIIGTPAEMIDKAENRFHFSRMLKSIDVDQPEWENATTLDKAKEFCQRVTYPCLIRPSYVLSGAAMKVVFNDKDLDTFLQNAKCVSNKHPVVISKFITDAKEIEVDAVAMNGVVKLIAISEHVENAGVHSGDATLILPARDLTEATVVKIKVSVDKIASSLKIHGPFNIQFIAKDDLVKVIECNVRVSRTFPFVSKTLGVNFVEVATQIMCGLSPNLDIVPNSNRIGVKVPLFSFNRLPGADILLDVEMQSTGEVACFGENQYEAYLKGLLAAGFKLPKGAVLLSIGSFKSKIEFTESVNTLLKLGFKIYGTHGTVDFYREQNLQIEELPLHSNDTDDTIRKYISQKRIGLIINISEKNKMRCTSTTFTEGYTMRQSAISSNIPIMTDIKCAKLLVASLKFSYDYNNSILNVKTDIDCFASYKTVRLPGMIDVHVHVRDPGQTHKEDFTSCTKAALAGGITAICAMPNTDPAICDESALQLVEGIAKNKACCDYALFVGASSSNSSEVHKLGSRAAALKLYLNNTFGPLLLENTSDWMNHIRAWDDSTRPICVHAESSTLPAVLYIAGLCKKRIHVCHVARKSEIEIIKATKQTGMLSITCEVAPHHLFMTNSVNDSPQKSVKPPLMTNDDVQSLWDNMDIIDCFATDHAPHIIEEKLGFSRKCSQKGGKTECCPGFPGLETALPLLLTAVNQGRLTLEDLVLKYHTNPKKIFHLPDQPNTYIEVELDRKHVIGVPKYSKCGWSPFEGTPVIGMVKRVVLRGKVVFVNGNVVAQPGSGLNMREVEYCNNNVVNNFGDGRKKHNIIYSTTIPIPIPIPPQQQLDQYHSPQQQQLSVSTFHNILSVDQFTRDHLRCLFDEADMLRDLVKQHGKLDLCKGKILANIFYEPSTRTRSSFHAAMLKLGGDVIEVSSETSSVKKGESIEDFVRCMERYCDIVVLRSIEHTYPDRAALVLQKPLINAGNGADEHPTQALLDIYTIRKELGTVNGITVVLVGDLKYGRTVHSLAKLLALYDVKLIYVSPKSLRMPKEITTQISEISKGKINQSEYTELDDHIIKQADIIYMTRVQKERFETVLHYESVKDSYNITPAILAKGKDSGNPMCPLPIVMHPMPRNNEISTEIDSDPRAAYFRQMENGMYIRMALLNLILNK